MHVRSIATDDLGGRLAALPLDQDAGASSSFRGWLGAIRRLPIRISQFLVDLIADNQPKGTHVLLKDSADTLNHIL
jgi:hypothetical protein